MITNLKTIGTYAKKIFKAFLYVLRGDLKGLYWKIKKLIKANRDLTALTRTVEKTGVDEWGVISTPHTLFIAHLITERLRAHGWRVEVMTSTPNVFSHGWYIVLCPQIFKKLPPGEKRIVFQLEQSVSTRWFTESYFHLLETSEAVLEYSLENINYLKNKSQHSLGYPLINYVPIGASETYGNSTIDNNHDNKSEEYDILFYGDSKSSQRRRTMLEALEKNYKLLIVNELFGPDMIQVIKQAKFVINIHYYEGALLELPRIQECLSLGVPVISEASKDQNDYPELQGAVLFFEEGSTNDMLSVVKNAFDHPISQESIKNSVKKSSDRFTFMFDRFLIGMGFLDPSYVKTMKLLLPQGADNIVLSLPETIERRRLFQEEILNTDQFIFDGIRRLPGWIGCGLSYLALANNALKQNQEVLTIMEDDVTFPPNFQENLKIVHEYLHIHAGQWDMFSGLISSLHPETQISSVEHFKGLTFITIDKMTSTVFNIYGPKLLKLLASWDPTNSDVISNTIDRYIEKQSGLKIIITLPFMVGHHEELDSSLWGFKNTQYNEMISLSEQSLRDKMMAYQENFQ